MTFIENNAKFSKGSTDLTLTLYHEQPFTETSSFGYTDYIFLEAGFAEILHGLYYMPGDQWMVAVYGGLEVADAQFRTGSYFWYEFGDKLSYSLFAEKGKGNDNHWYDTSFKYEYLQNESLSLYIQPRLRRFHGIGMPIGIQKNNIFGSDFAGLFSISPFIDLEDGNKFNVTAFFAVDF